MVRMIRPRVLPTELIGRAFLVSDATACGVTPGRLRAADLTHPHRGVRSVPVARPRLLGRCREFDLLMVPGHAFSHVTAAFLYGIPLPNRCGNAPIHVIATGGVRAPRVHGVCAHSDATERTGIRLVDTLVVCAPADTWCQLAQVLSREDLVAAGDFLISGRRTDVGREAPLATVEELMTAVGLRPDTRGIRVLRWAVPLLRERVDSRPESRLRLQLVAAGLPEPTVSRPIQVDGGTRILHPDLAWEHWRIVLEYEGDEHRTSTRRFRGDITRREKFETAGWRVIRVTADDLFVDPAAFIARVRRIIQERERALRQRP